MSSVTPDIVRIYLQEIGRFPLLTHEQEIAYGTQVQQMMGIESKKDALQKQLNRQPTSSELALDVDKSEAEVTRILHQGQRAKEKMVTSNLRLVVSIAKKYQHRNLEFTDLIQEGALGLQRGVEKFDPSLGYKFSTYAYWWITQSMTRAIAEKSRTVRLPFHISEKLNKIKKVQRETYQTLGRPATISEIAEAMGSQPQQIREYLSASRGTISLDLRVGEEKDTELIQLIPDDGTSLDEQVTQEFLQQDLSDLMASLTPIQREVLSLRFGLNSDQELNLRQVAERLNLSGERVRQIQQKAMNILRRDQEQIREYLVS
jgi:RNA polymerase nonessential primary-like sigma factor